jgi:hypothetical protein
VLLVAGSLRDIGGLLAASTHIRMLPGDDLLTNIVPHK